MNTLAIVSLAALGCLGLILVAWYRSRHDKPSAVSAFPKTTAAAAPPPDQLSPDLNNAVRAAWAKCGTARSLVAKNPGCDNAEDACNRALRCLAMLSRKLLPEGASSDHVLEMAHAACTFADAACERLARHNRDRQLGSR